MPADCGNSLISKPDAMLRFFKWKGEKTTTNQAVLCESDSWSPCVVGKQGCLCLTEVIIVTVSDVDKRKLLDGFYVGRKVLNSAFGICKRK